MMLFKFLDKNMRTYFMNDAEAFSFFKKWYYEFFNRLGIDAAIKDLEEVFK